MNCKGQWINGGYQHVDDGNDHNGSGDFGDAGGDGGVGGGRCIFESYRAFFVSGYLGDASLRLS